MEVLIGMHESKKKEKISLSLSIFFPVLFLSSFNKWERGRQRNACVRFPIVLKEKELVSSTYCTQRQDYLTS
jgi:hypothetical protein